LKKSLPVFLILIIIITAWFVSGFWITDSPGIGNSKAPPEPSESNTQTSGTDDEDNEEERLAKQLEAERLEAERLEAERIKAELIEAELSLRREVIIEESRLLYKSYFYEEAIALLNEDETLINSETQSMEAEIIAAINSLERFDGDIKHIFFHSLILYPQHLFTNLNVPTGGYNEGFIYQSEMIRLLPQLLERGYVLYDINEVFGKDENGNMQKKDIFLPPGKRPLILSIDDPSYHYGQRFIGGGFDRNRVPNAGFANRVIMDENGELATEVITPEGEMIITYDGDVHIVIDAFVKEHPEFSYRGAKGIIAATGYMGIFGYDLPDLRDEEIRNNVIAICDKFKENGWLFASHSYTHNRTGFWGPESNPNNIRFDIRRWKEEIEPLTGQTNLFIAPFGYLLRGEGMQVIIDNGFDIYCTVDFNQPYTVNNTHAVMGRIEIGGYSLVRWANTLNRDFFDVDYVKDSHRPPIISN